METNRAATIKTIQSGISINYDIDDDQLEYLEDRIDKNQKLVHIDTIYGESLYINFDIIETIKIY